jgi:hypothetical protein|nr:hypothetical protein [Heyndrickxia oleronia]
MDQPIPQSPPKKVLDKVKQTKGESMFGVGANPNERSYGEPIDWQDVCSFGSCSGGCGSSSKIKA